MGTNESKYAWMDEGWAAYIDFMASSALYSTEIIKRNRITTYKKAIGNDIDIPIFAISKYLKSPPYRYNAYIKAAGFYDILREYLGHDRFAQAIHEYMARWNGKHPIPYDFFFSMSNASGEDLSWLIKPWFFEYGYMDLAVKDVSVAGDKYKIEIEKRGLYPGGFNLTISYTDGTSEIVSESVAAWKNGSNFFTIEKPAFKKITKVELWNAIWLDADNSNDIYIVK
jgi:aminopeptidase N